MVPRDDPHGLARGLTNYGDADFSLYLRRSFRDVHGLLTRDARAPRRRHRAVASGFNNCHRHFPELIDAVKRGVVAAGGLPLDFPTISLGEVFLSPTSMMFRNLMAIDVEEMIRAQPMDAVVLVGGCDKTVPAQLMGAASADVPAVQLLAGPMMPMAYHGERLGACTDCRRFWAKYRAGGLSATEIQEIEGNLATTAGTCGGHGHRLDDGVDRGDARMTLPGTAAIPPCTPTGCAPRRPAPSGGGARGGEASAPHRSSRASPSRTRSAVLLAIGGSTNAIIHLTAIAGRVGVADPLAHLNELSDSTPVLVDLKPTGQHYMSDLHAAGGVGAVLRELKPLLHLDCLTVSGETLGQRLAAEPGWVDRAVVRPLDDPTRSRAASSRSSARLRPRRDPERSAADPALFEREGRAVVFASLDDLAARIDRADLDVTPDDFLVLQNAGPKSGYAMPEAGYLPIPAKLAKTGVKDMVRISDARMSGTAYGTIVLHVSPEAAVGGPLALVKTGDRIRLSVAQRSINLMVDEAELGRRRAAWRAPTAPPTRGYAKLYMQSVLQAEHGCDFDFLRKAGADSVNRKRLTGVLSPSSTPFKADLSPDAGEVRAPCRWLLSQNVGLAVFGTNSEANSLATEEKIDLLDRLIAAGVDPRG